MKERYYYLISIQYLGFRYSGWQKQPNGKTIQGMIDKTFECLFNHTNFKTLGAGRTDAKVSADCYAFELFVYESLNCEQLLNELNENLPPDIRALTVRSVNSEFNIINDVEYKEYCYTFTDQPVMNPSACPYMVNFNGPLNTDLMNEGAKLFIGHHNFFHYCYKPGENSVFEREILSSEVSKCLEFQGAFFPENSWQFKIKGKGFLRHQVRLMMGALIGLGQGEITLDAIEESLSGKDVSFGPNIVPSSGLKLCEIHFKESHL